MKLLLETVSTPIGDADLVSDAQSNLLALDWSVMSERRNKLLKKQHGLKQLSFSPSTRQTEALKRFVDYLDGDLSAIDNIAVRFGGTVFQRQVWQALNTIQSGQTTTYGALASKIGRQNAVRALGAAVGANPVSVIVPCHRVIGQNGKLTGYAGGLERKSWLLNHEGALSDHML